MQTVVGDKNRNPKPSVTLALSGRINYTDIICCTELAKHRAQQTHAESH